MNPSPSRTRGLAAALALALLLPLGTGCDTEATVGLDASFFVGNWRMESVRDQGGDRDRTSEVRQVVNDLRATFRADGTFSLLMDFTAEGQADQTLTGTYTVSPTGQIMLNVTPPGSPSPIAVPFDASVQGDNAVDLRASATVVQLLLAGTGVDFGLVGTVVLRLTRGGPGA